MVGKVEILAALYTWVELIAGLIEGALPEWPQLVVVVLMIATMVLARATGYEPDREIRHGTAS